MALSWSTRRQFLYYVVAGLVGMVVLFGTWEVFFTKQPTCFDGVKNGIELGIDCGGSCQLLCKEQTRAPLVKWERSFRSGPTTYTAAAYITNPNASIGAGAHNVTYSFKLYDSENVLVAQKDGVIDIPPMNEVPVIEPNVEVGNRTVTYTRIKLGDAEWHTVKSEEPRLTVSEEGAGFDGNRLSASLQNDTVTDSGRVIVTAVLFDSEGTARGASKTVIAKVPRKSSQPLVFTWPEGVPNIINVDMKILPSF